MRPLRPPAPFAAWAAGAFGEAALIEYANATAGIYRCAALVGDRLEAILFVGPAGDRLCWSAARAAFAATALDRDARIALLSGRTPEGGGALVCACFGVTLPAIRDAVRTGRAETPEALGALLRAGTNCGSCLPDLKRIIAHERTPASH
ncbi:hypothetical protein F0L46_19445 [Salinarimonas soli]|uniref:BFD-like [2Fe-2S]-binding domain-containing protein n=1 Tax=Salinarimonas soli TaxID=1638099 RepID=A0A5B2V871_9HYPH|nr:hypothetical protein F0L46_19445 [Salinarimonas soli]